MKPLIYTVKQCRDMMCHVRHALVAPWVVRGLVVVLLLPLLIFASCSSDSSDGADDTPQMKSVLVRFTISVGQNTTGNGAKQNTLGQASQPAAAKAGTRADTDVDWTKYDPAEDGVGIENRIEVSRLHVLLYTVGSDGKTPGRLAGEVRNLILTPDASDPTKYQVDGNMLLPTDLLVDGIETFRGRVMIFANCDATSSVANSAWTPANLDNVTYAYEADKSVGSPSTLTLNSIPMWGMSAVQSLTLKGGVRNNLGDIDLLRSMAKVTVSLRSDMATAGFKFSEIRLSRYNTSGAVMPPYANVSALTAEQGTRNLTFANSFHLPAGVAAVDTPLSFMAEDGGTESQTLYIPEYDNTSTGATPATISVKMVNNKGNEVSGTLQFVTYNNGQATANSAYNIVRNHYYKFEVYSSGERVNLSVTPWVEFTHDPFTWK